MKVFKGKTVVITGAASGIGRAIAERCARAEMKIVLADIEEAPLLALAEELRAKGADILAVRTDVSKLLDMEKLAQRAIDTFGKVHLLFNNAGVIGAFTSLWKSTMEDWEWVISVNLYGVIHGVRVFVPIMLAQEDDCHVVNTASLGALVYAQGGLYSVTKHAVVGLSETLYRELLKKKSRIKVSVFCPAFVNTRIQDSYRNYPFAKETICIDEDYKKLEQTRGQAVQQGLEPEEAVDILFRGIEEEKLYILTNYEEAKPMIQYRMECIQVGKGPQPGRRRAQNRPLHGNGKQ